MRTTREQVLRFRWRQQELDRATDSRKDATQVAILDLGVQSGAGDAGRVALRARGVTRAEADRVTSGFTDDLALTWSLRGAPHFYRRADLAEIERAVWPVSAADAAKRSAGAAKASIDHLQALCEIGRELHGILTKPMTKGEASAALTPRLPPDLLTDCRPCKATHCHEQLFRIAALHGGLEHEPGTNPPTLRRIPGARPAKTPVDPREAKPAHHVGRAYLHFLGPATPKDLAAFLETTVTEAKKLWPDDAVEVDRAGEKAWLLPEDVRALESAAEPDKTEPGLKLLNGFDLFLAAKDRHLLTDGNKDRHKELWPVLGRPGVLVSDGLPLAAWRPRTKGKRFHLQVSWWSEPTKAQRSAVDDAAEVMVATGVEYAGLA
ncbi:DNA glycosylase AlkZ-like family protein [Granulicoccus sp. GXG6511]|uniref:DNA glycosylase AlkZ-like family protein n=1 Tax=Granulicoccus sp. GXG6511 TaxID=3381351 RepID=UPI003D7CC6B3